MMKRCAVVLAALKSGCVARCTKDYENWPGYGDHVRDRLERGDNAALHSLSSLTTDVALLARMRAPATRRLLKLLQADGLVLESPTTGGTTRWWPVGLAAELIATPPVPEDC